MASFTSRPTKVDAVQLAKASKAEARELAGLGAQFSAKGLSAKVYAKGGTQVAESGDWIIKHADGSLSVMKADAFTQNYGKAGSK